MLVLSRRKNETIELEHDGTVIKVTVVRIDSSRVRLGFEAPQDVRIIRSEIKTQKENDV